MSGQVFVTGDTHGDFERFSYKQWPHGKTLVKDDYVIIAGDFGGIWDSSKNELRQMKWLSEKPWTTLFIDGNHENFDIIDNLPQMDKFGGKVGSVSDSIFHLKRGYIYNIAGNDIFTFGGGLSIDKHYRKEGKSWWAREQPSEEEIEQGWEVIKSGKNIDYVISHVPPHRFIDNPYGTSNQKFFDPVTYLMDDFYCQLHDKIKMWFYGHMHMDKQHNEIVMGLYYQMKKLIDNR